MTDKWPNPQRPQGDQALVKIDHGVHERQNPNLKKGKDLTKFCYRNGNPIVIIDFGENLDLENIQINPEILKVINSENPDSLDTMMADIKKIKSYLNGPIFTDNFGEDHSSTTGRRGWEKKMDELIPQDLLEYYNSNRLGSSRNNQAISFLDSVIYFLEDSGIKNKLVEIKNKIPKDLTQKNSENDLLFHFINDADKVACIKEFSQLIREALSVLEKQN